VSSSPIAFGRPWITDDDRRAVARVLDGPILTHGPECTAFEEEMGALIGGGVHCVSVSSCMAALHLAYLEMGIGPGDEVVVPAQTHVATAHAVEMVGARPVFVDCDPATGNVTADLVEPAIGPRTRAISLVHYLGIPCDMPGIVELAGARGLRVIEDCALAVGAAFDGVHVGLAGDAGCFSFYPVKHLTSGEGGMFVTRHADVARRVRLIRGFGIDRTHGERTAPGVYDVPSLGLNYRMSELQAALGRSQLSRVQEILRRRAENFRIVATMLTDLPHLRVIDATDPRAANSHYCMAIVLEGPLAERRTEMAARINALGVGTSIYYPQPVPRMAYYREKYGYDPLSVPNAEEISDRSISLPVAQHLTADDARRVGETVVMVTEEMG
jgi:dTDP-4-amino-4,6-dideoxygalactose transaminase